MYDGYVAYHCVCCYSVSLDSENNNIKYIYILNVRQNIMRAEERQEKKRESETANQLRDRESERGSKERNIKISYEFETNAF